MRWGQVGIWSVELRLGDPAEIADRASELDELGWGTLWIPGLGGGPVLGDVERLLKAAPRATVTTGVISIFRHDPKQIAADHHRLRKVYGERIVLGLGVSDPAAARGAGRPFKPIADMNRYLDQLDKADTPVPAAERILAALGPRMTGLGQQRAAGVHPFLVTPDTTAATRSLLGPDPILAPYQAVVLNRDADTARAVAREFLAPALTMPHYERNLMRQGFIETELAGGGSDRLIDALVAWGDIDAITARVHAHRDAGANHVAIHVLTDTPGFPRREWRELAPLTT